MELNLERHVMGRVTPAGPQTTANRALPEVAPRLQFEPLCLQPPVNQPRALGIVLGFENKRVPDRVRDRRGEQCWEHARAALDQPGKLVGEALGGL